jgi:dienelactone hydrolase
MSHLALVQTRTADGLRLDGSLARPAQASTAPLPVDAVLALHGTGSNFYGSGLFEGLAPKLLADGLAVLRANTRGHDALNMTATLHGPKRIGAAVERVSEATFDVIAWLEYLAAQGFQSIAVVGHSLGAIKALYTHTHCSHPAMTRLVAISPPRLSHSYYVASENGDAFLAQYHMAEKHVATGRGETLLEFNFPIEFIFSAANYLDKYGPEEKYNFLKHIDRLQVPTLFLFGSVEIEEVNFRGLPEAVAGAASPAQRIQVATISGANHVYTGQIDALSHKIRAWLAVEK